MAILNPATSYMTEGRCTLSTSKTLSLRLKLVPICSDSTQQAKCRTYCFLNNSALALSTQGRSLDGTLRSPYSPQVTMFSMRLRMLGHARAVIYKRPLV